MSEFGIELEWFVLLIIAIVGEVLFAPFEIGTAKWKRLSKWAAAIALTYLVYVIVGHWALLVIVSMSLVGTAVHFVWCRRNGINPWNATPRRKYYELRGWSFEEDRL